MVQTKELLVTFKVLTLTFAHVTHHTCNSIIYIYVCVGVRTCYCTPFNDKTDASYVYTVNLELLVSSGVMLCFRKIT